MNPAAILPMIHRIPHLQQDLAFPRIAVIGAGRWGKNLIRNFNALEHLVAICDLDPNGLEELKPQYPNLDPTSAFYTDLNAVYENPAIDAIVIATPSWTHFGLCEAALNHGKHVYVEKPMATSTADCQILFNLAEAQGKVLMVGHLLMYHPAVIRLKQLIEEGVLGEIKYLQSDRLNFNPYRSDKSVLWDLAPHDLSMMAHLMGEDPATILSVQGHQTSTDGLIDVAHLEIQFPSGAIGHIHNSWIHPQKQVKLVVRGTEQTAVLDDTLATQKLQLFYKNNLQQPSQEFPDYLAIEPLKLECQHFINAIRQNRPPKTDGLNGYAMVKILELAEQQLA